jgi:hypothetical protein
VFIGENALRGAMISYFLKTAATGDVKITIADVNNRTNRTLDGTRNQGINRVLWTNLAPAPPPDQAGQAGRGGGGGRGGFGQPVAPGTYLVTLSANGKTMTKPITVLQDVWLREK